MCFFRSTAAFISLAAAMALGADVSPVSAQGSHPAETRQASPSPHVAIVAVRLPDSIHAVVLRRPNLTPQNVILVDQKATGSELAMAMATLGVLRMRDGDVLTQAVQVPVRGHLHSSAAAQREIAHYQSTLAALRRATAVDVAGVGVVPKIELSIGGRPVSGSHR